MDYRIRYYLLTVVVVFFISRLAYQNFNSKYTVYDMMDTAKYYVYCLLAVGLFGILEISYAS